MSFATMMVHVDVDPPSDARIRLAARLAARFQATLIGACAWEPRPPLTYGGVVVDAKITEDMLRGISARLDQAGEHFRTLVEPDQPVEWRSAIESPTEFVIKQARAADLLIVSRDRMAGCSLDPGAVVLKAGRPLLAVPPDIQSLIAERVVIGWKDTREARRALRDSLPLIRESLSVVIIEIVDFGGEKQAQTHIDDVARYLARHHIAVTVRTTAYSAGSVQAELIRVAEEINADLIVAGGYGHSRLGEWIFGGVTQGLLATSPVCCLLSH
jgi:nucleotide-binding universal stress UspA family protein